MRKKVGIALSIGAVVVAASIVYFAEPVDVESPLGASTTAGTLHVSAAEAPFSPAPPVIPESPPARSEPPGEGRDSKVAEPAPNPSSNRKLLESQDGDEYKRLVRSLRLSADDSERLLDILADELKAIREWQTANRRSFFAQDEVDSLRTDSNRRALDLLGHDRFQQYEDYRKHPSERKWIDRLSERLVSSGSAPLYQNVDEQLYAALKEETNRTPAPLVSSYGSHVEYTAALKKWRDENTRRFLERASRLLTYDELTMLQNVVR